MDLNGAYTPRQQQLNEADNASYDPLQFKPWSTLSTRPLICIQCVNVGTTPYLLLGGGQRQISSDCLLLKDSKEGPVIDSLVTQLLFAIGLERIVILIGTGDRLLNTEQSVFFFFF